MDALNSIWMQLNNFVSSFAEECGAEFGSSGSFVIDHVAYDHSDNDGFHTLIAADNFVNTAVFGSAKPSPVLYRG
jgi:oligosaccharyltransferase complex subunit beta